MSSATLIIEDGTSLRGEASGAPADAVVVHSLARRESNWRACQSLSEWLAAHGVPGICEIDTRLLTRKLREQGTMKAALSSCGTEFRETMLNAGVPVPHGGGTQQWRGDGPRRPFWPCFC
jgi:carbamoylphosphate synthase small subunit